MFEFIIGGIAGFAAGLYLGRYQGDRVSRWLAKARLGRGGQ